MKVRGDNTIDYYTADVLSAQDYYPFGMTMPGRKTAEGYRFGFGGQEKDDELKGQGNSLDFGARIYDPRTGRFFSIDPKYKDFLSLSPYVFAANNPIKYIDANGEGPIDYSKSLNSIVTEFDKEINQIWGASFHGTKRNREVGFVIVAEPAGS